MLRPMSAPSAVAAVGPAGCTTPLPRVESTPFDAVMASLALAGCIGTVVLGARALWMYAILRDPKTFAEAKAAADDEANADAQTATWHQQRLRTIRACSNLFNDAILFCIGVCVAWALVESYFFIVMIARYALHEQDRDMTWNAYYLTVNECRVSAIAQQHFVITSTVISTLYCFGLAVVPLGHRTLFFSAQVSGALSTLALWYGTELNTQKHVAFVYFAGLPWCWFPNGGGTLYKVLKFASAYLFVFVFFFFGALALWAIRRRLKSSPSAQRITELRLVPQLVVFFLIIVCGGAMRFVISPTDAKEQAPSFKLLAVGLIIGISFHGALSSVAWAYGEGLLPALVMPWRYSVMNLETYADPFSSIMLQQHADGAVLSGRGLGQPLQMREDSNSAPTDPAAHAADSRFATPRSQPNFTDTRQS